MSEMLGLVEMSIRQRSQFTTINLSDVGQFEAEGMKYVREMLPNTLKIPEFEVVTWKALIWMKIWYEESVEML